MSCVSKNALGRVENVILPVIVSKDIFLYIFRRIGNIKGNCYANIYLRLKLQLTLQLTTSVQCLLHDIRVVREAVYSFFH